MRNTVPPVLAIVPLVALAAVSLSITSPALAARSCDSAGLDLPDGFCATVYAGNAGTPRHLAVAADNTVYINLADNIAGHGLMALRDTDGDGVADERKTFGKGGGTGLRINKGWLYAATITDIYRYRLDQNMVPSDAPQPLVTGLPDQHEHSARGMAISKDGQLFVNIGAPSNACQKSDRTPGSRGRDPCPLLSSHGGIWRFSATKKGQRFSAKARFATGIRNLFALAYDNAGSQLYGVQHGRDQLHSNWPDTFTQRESAHLPAEEMFAIDKGDNFGWPFCYYDPGKHKKVLGPEYGGDGDRIGRCNEFEAPIAAYPAHWAPMDMLIYTGAQFPEKYRKGAFVAFHGSWNRAPEPQAGYRVVFQPFNRTRPSGHYIDFAGPHGFTGKAILRSPGNARHRPAGLAQGPDGALYISDDQSGTIFRVTYSGG